VRAAHTVAVDLPAELEVELVHELRGLDGVVASRAQLALRHPPQLVVHAREEAVVGGAIALPGAAQQERRGARRRGEDVDGVWLALVHGPVPGRGALRSLAGPRALALARRGGNSAPGRCARTTAARPGRRPVRAAHGDGTAIALWRCGLNREMP
jgi:hypothetical protein